jgi:hypothetical protein
MDILVTEAVAGAATSAAEELEAAGHRVHRCREAAAPAFPCAGLGGDGCPLDQAPIDLVLTVRPHVRTTPTPTEDGVACGLRRHVPVAVYGQTVMNPFAAYGAETVEGDLVAECERIARATRTEHERVALEVIHDTLRTEGFPTDPSDVTVHRVGGRLRVLVGLSRAVPERARQIVAVRVVGRLREFDTDAAGIDIGLATVDDESASEPPSTP